MHQVMISVGCNFRAMLLVMPVSEYGILILLSLTSAPATAAEYVAYNIPVLAKKSATGKVFLVGYSQGGGLNIPWVRSIIFTPARVLNFRE